MSIGVIGVGMVGGTIVKDFEKKFKVNVYDKYKKMGSWEEVLNSDLIFVCVPTPTVDGMQDLLAIHEVLFNIAESAFKGPVILKSTVLPGTCDILRSTYPYIKLLHSPEFLTERNAFEDFMKQPAVLVSCPAEYEYQVLSIILGVFGTILPNTKVCFVADFQITEFCKYIHNCFLATKVAFMNQMYDYAQKRGIEWNHAINFAVEQGVIGASHTKVPGPDGLRGFGGSCFPKDTEAILNGSGNILSILHAAVTYNHAVRGIPGALTPEVLHNAFKLIADNDMTDRPMAGWPKNK